MSISKRHLTRFLCSNLQAPCSLTFHLIDSMGQIHSIFSSLNKPHSLRSFFLFFPHMLFSCLESLPSLFCLPGKLFPILQDPAEMSPVWSLPESFPENRSLPPLSYPSNLTLSLLKHFITLCHNVLVRLQQVPHTHEAVSSSRGSVLTLCLGPQPSIMAQMWLVLSTFPSE